MAASPLSDQGRRAFVKRMLDQDREADDRSINRAWREAGHTGSIDARSIGKVRSELARAQVPVAQPTSDRSQGDQPRAAATSTSQVNGSAAPDRPQRPPSPEAKVKGRGRALEELERDLDQLLFRVMEIGGLAEVEEGIRRSRRLVILASLSARPSVAVVGASTDRAKYGNKAVRAFLRSGFEVYPVNPNAEHVEGIRAYANLEDLPVDRLDRVSLYVPPAVGLRVLDQAARLRVGEVWLNPGADTPEVVARAEALGLKVIQACSILAVGDHPDRL